MFSFNNFLQEFSDGATTKKKTTTKKKKTTKKVATPVAIQSRMMPVLFGVQNPSGSADASTTAPDDYSDYNSDTTADYSTVQEYDDGDSNANDWNNNRGSNNRGNNNRGNNNRGNNNRNGNKFNPPNWNHRNDRRKNDRQRQQSNQGPFGYLKNIFRG